MAADRYDVMVVLPPAAGSSSDKKTWQKIGVAFAQRNGTGFSIELAAMPIPQGDRIRLVMMEARAFGGGGTRPVQRDRFPDRAPPTAGPGSAPGGDPNDSMDDLPW